MSQDDGGPAFPAEDAEGFRSVGMSLRDYFAGQALAGLLADKRDWPSLSDYSQEAYRLSDAMLQARTDERGKK